MNLSKMVQVYRSIVLYSYMFPPSEELPGNKDHSSSTPKSKENEATLEGAPLNKSSFEKGKKALKGKIIAYIDFTTCTSAVLRRNIERYDERSTQVPQCLLGYVTTINNFKLDDTICLFDLSLLMML